MVKTHNESALQKAVMSYGELCKKSDKYLMHTIDFCEQVVSQRRDSIILYRSVLEGMIN